MLLLCKSHPPIPQADISKASQKDNYLYAVYIAILPQKRNTYEGMMQDTVEGNKEQNAIDPVLKCVSGIRRPIYIQ